MHLQPKATKKLKMKMLNPKSKLFFFFFFFFFIYFILVHGNYFFFIRIDLDEISFVDCLCGYGEEDGQMVGCDICHAWSHAHCLGYGPDTPAAVLEQLERVCPPCQERLAGKTNPELLLEAITRGVSYDEVKEKTMKRKKEISTRATAADRESTVTSVISGNTDAASAATAIATIEESAEDSESEELDADDYDCIAWVRPRGWPLWPAKINDGSVRRNLARALELCRANDGSGLRQKCIQVEFLGDASILFVTFEDIVAWDQHAAEKSLLKIKNPKFKRDFEKGYAEALELLKDVKFFLF